jgi:hypothetical protein
VKAGKLYEIKLDLHESDYRHSTSTVQHFGQKSRIEINVLGQPADTNSIPKFTRRPRREAEQIESEHLNWNSPGSSTQKFSVSATNLTGNATSDSAADVRDTKSDSLIKLTNPPT